MLPTFIKIIIISKHSFRLQEQHFLGEGDTEGRKTMEKMISIHQEAVEVFFYAGYLKQLKQMLYSVISISAAVDLDPINKKSLFVPNLFKNGSES